MKNLIKATIIALLLTSVSVYAHGHSHDGGHSHVEEASKSKIKSIAKDALQDLIKQKKIDKSWSDISIKDMEKKKFNGHNEWVVSFKNLKIDEISKQNVYIFMKLSGKITGANYTGK